MSFNPDDTIPRHVIYNSEIPDDKIAELIKPFEVIEIIRKNNAPAVMFACTMMEKIEVRDRVRAYENGELKVIIAERESGSIYTNAD